MDVKKLDAILKAVNGSGARRVSIESKTFKLKMVKAQGAAAPATALAGKKEIDGGLHHPHLDIKTFENIPDKFKPASTAEAGQNDICSDFIGFFSRFNNQTKKQYVKLRDVVKKGDVVGVVTSMHVDHEVIAQQEGKITQFLVEEGQPVEYGQPLMRLES